MSWLDTIQGGLQNGFDSLTGKKGLDTAAQGARDAQSQANELSQLQWARQMEGLQRALGMMGPSQSLYDRIYGTNTAQTRNLQAGGFGLPGGMPPPGAGGGPAGGSPPPASPVPIRPMARMPPPMMGAGGGGGAIGDTGRIDVPTMGTNHGFVDNRPIPGAVGGMTPIQAPIMRTAPPGQPGGSILGGLRAPNNPYLEQLQRSLRMGG